MDLAELPWGAVGALTPSALLLIAVLLILRGDLIPRRTAEREIATHKEDSAIWRKVSETKDAQVSTLAETNRTLSHEVGTTVTKVMDELQARARKGADGDG